MRNAFSEELTKLSIKNKKIILLSGDIGNKLFDNFKKKYPKRFINCGVAEANMTTVAAGLAYAGYTPITYTITSFNIFKTVEQIKLDICYPNLPVIIVGVGSGLAYSNLGTTHHSIEDIGVLNSISNLNIISPADSKELKVLLPQVLKVKKPVYFRIGKKKEKTIYKNKCKSVLGEPSIINIHTVKPFNEKKIIKYLKIFKKILILEEHVDRGGLSDLIMKTSAKFKLKNIFINHNAGNNFLIGVGDNKNARKILKLDSSSIAKSIIKLDKM